MNADKVRPTAGFQNARLLPPVQAEILSVLICDHLWFHYLAA